MIQLLDMSIELYKNYKSGNDIFKPTGVNKYTYDILSDKIIKILNKTIN